MEYNDRPNGEDGRKIIVIIVIIKDNEDMLHNVLNNIPINKNFAW